MYLQELLNDAKENRKSPSVIVSAVYSIRWGHKMALVENPTEHLMVQSIVNAFKRILGRPVKAKEPLSIDIVQSIASFYLTSVPSLAELRFLFVLPVGHAGLLRADELLSVRYKDINIEEDKNLFHRERMTSIGKVISVTYVSQEK